MKLLFKDGQTLTVQSAEIKDGKLVVNAINNVYQQLKYLFTDPVTTGKITAEDDAGKTVAIYENYTVFDSITEKSGGIFIVELEQASKDTATRLAELEKEKANLQKRVVELEVEVTQAQIAMCELYEMMEV